MACYDHGSGRPSGFPRVLAPATYHLGTPRNQHPVVTRLHAHLSGLATAIHGMSGLEHLGSNSDWPEWSEIFDKKGGAMATEKRQHPRVEISWSATIITPDGLLSCRTENLSADGTLIRCSELPDTLDRFRLVLKPSERQLILATAERVWSKTVDTDRKTAYTMGVRFIFIPDHDYQQINAAISSNSYGQKSQISAAL